MSTKRRRGRKNWWQTSNHGMKNWVSVTLVGVLAIGAASLAGLALTREAPTGTAAAGTQPTSLENDRCEPGDQHLTRTATALRDGQPVRLAVLGDSTRDENAAGQTLITSLRTQLPKAEVRSFGRNGSSIEAYTANEELQASIRAYDPTMIELSMGINDLRQGGATGDQVTARLNDYVDALHTDLPDAEILLTVPAALSTQNVGDANFIVGADKTVNPDGMAQTITEQLHAAYLAAESAHDYVALLDVQDKVTGTEADTSPTPKFLRDQIHPTDQVNQQIASLIRGEIGDICS